MHNSQKIEPYTWRQNWLVKNVLADAPFGRDFFKNDKYTCSAIAYAAGKCIFSLFFGSLDMVIVDDYFTVTEHNATTHTAAMIGSMIGGMWEGKVIFNCLYSGSTVLYQYACKSRTKETPDVDLEMQELTSEENFAQNVTNETEEKTANGNSMIGVYPRSLFQ